MGRQVEEAIEATRYDAIDADYRDRATATQSAGTSRECFVSAICSMGQYHDEAYVAR